MRTLIWKGQKNIILAKKGRKWPKRFFENFWVEPGNLSNLANWIKKTYFLCGFLKLIIENTYENKEKVHSNEARMRKIINGISDRTFEFPVERSKFKKTGHPKISVVRRISGRTFKIQKDGSSKKFGGTSKFRSNVQNQKKRVIRKWRSHPKNHIKTI